MSESHEFHVGDLVEVKTTGKRGVVSSPQSEASRLSNYVIVQFNGTGRAHVRADQLEKVDDDG